MQKTQYSTILQKPVPLSKYRTEKCFPLMLQAQNLQVQFIVKPKRKVNSKHISKCLGNINKDQKFHDLLSSEDDYMEFNVPKASQPGCQFERLIDLIKSILYRTIGKALLTWAELEKSNQILK